MRLSARGKALACACAVLAIWPASSQAATANEKATATAQVAVLTPGSMVKIQDMNFGSLAQYSGTATIVMTASVSPTCTVTGNIIRSGPCQAAGFSVSGRKNWLVRIRELNSGVVTLNGPSGATMTMTNFTIGMNASDVTSVPGGGQSTGLFGRWRIDNNTGITNFYIGGKLNVGAAQAVGVYHGTLVIQVQYN